MDKRILLKGGTVVDPSQELHGRADLVIEGNRIVDLAPSIASGDGEVETIDVTGKIVAPGMVDIHVHLREPGEEEKETIATGTAAAVAGGVTTVCCMPNTDPAVDNKLVVAYIKEHARQANLAHVYPIGALTRGRGGREMTDYASLLSAGVKAFSDDGSYVNDSMIMMNIMKYLSQFEVVAISHCEDAGLAAGGVAHDGYYANLLGLGGMPHVAETAAVGRDILIAEATGGKLHIAHVSCAASVELIRWAKERGIQVTAEVTPHHLLLTEEALEGYNVMAKMNPPLRSKEDREALLHGLQDGVIDIIASDHAPHRREDKERPFADAAFGVSSLDYGLSLLFNELVHTGMISIDKLVDCYSCRPAKILDLPAGTLKKGAVADIVVLDPELGGKVDPKRFYSRGQNTPFEGYPTRGGPVMTFVEGKLKMKEGKVSR
ncbi:MAG: dihydroorotase [Firmicutes bacterium]|nr:dihydroorotase [Bacillota bacterium]